MQNIIHKMQAELEEDVIISVIALSYKYKLPVMYHIIQISNMILTIFFFRSENLLYHYDFDMFLKHNSKMI